MKRLVLLSCLAWAASAWAGDGPRPIPSVRLQGAFTYETLHGKECRKVNPKLVERWDQGFWCMPPSPDAPSHEYAAKCSARTGKQVFLVFKTRAECVAARDAQPGSEPAE